MGIEDVPRRHAWTRWAFRVVVTCEAVLVAGQAVLAGGFLGGRYPLLALHQENASVTGITTVVLTLVAVLQWRPGRGPSWPVFVGAGLFAAEAAQIAIGYARILLVHVPLGVAIICGVVLLLVRVWSPGWCAANQRRPDAAQV